MAVHLAKVLGGITMKQTVKVAAPSLKFDDFLKRHFRENTEILAHDPKEEAKPGDWVLVRELPQPLSLQVKHQLLRIVYKNGNMIDPVTGRKCIGTEFEDEINQDTELFGWKNIHERHSATHK
jgi:small subunit ribosomal protein S17